MWTGQRGTRRWFCDTCGGSKDYRTKGDTQRHQETTGHTGITRGAKQYD